MQFFIDTADIDEIKHYANYGLVNGITTNPTLIYKSGRDFKEVIKEISDLQLGDVSAEVVETENEEIMFEQGMILSNLNNNGNIIVKVPCTFKGLKVCRLLGQEGISCNVTLCFSSVQALLAAKVGAKYISPFVGRLDDTGYDGMILVQEIADIYANQFIQTHILVASIRNKDHITKAAKITGVEYATIPPKVMSILMDHTLTDKGIKSFNNDWKRTGQKF